MPNDCNGMCIFSFILGIANLFVPFAANHVATFLGKTDIATFNSNMLMILSVLIVVFLTVNCIGHMNNRNNRYFFLTTVLLVINLVILVFNFATFIIL